MRSILVCTFLAHRFASHLLKIRAGQPKFKRMKSQIVTKGDEHRRADILFSVSHGLTPVSTVDYGIGSLAPCAL